MPPGTLQPTYKRQRFLLEFLQHLSDGASITDIQKLIFLYTMDTGSSHYSFIPYRFGPYSFQLAEDIDLLRKTGFLMRKGSKIYAAQESVQETIIPIADERGDTLIRKVYRKYPYYTINSEILGRLFDHAEIRRFKDTRISYRKNEQILFTIGYEAKSLEDFINQLIQNDIMVVCDVRRNPLSRKFGFSKSKLQHILETIGIRYVHIPELGIESQKRTHLNSGEDYQNLFKEYEDTLPDRKWYLDFIYSLLCENKRIALMCFEKEAFMCHRHIIRDYLLSEYHIRSDDL